MARKLEAEGKIVLKPESAKMSTSSEPAPQAKSNSRQRLGSNFQYPTIASEPEYPAPARAFAGGAAAGA